MSGREERRPDGAGSLAGRVVVLTGPTSGIGEVAAFGLAGRGARLVLVARDPARGAWLLDRLPRPAGGTHSLHVADLSLLARQRAVAAAILAAEPRIDVLVNNAGAMFPGGTRTADGLAPSFSLNHVAYHVLALSLLPALRAAGGGRIVCTASRAHFNAPLLPAGFGLDALQRDGWRGYALSKLLNLWFVRELARRLAGSGVRVDAHHPGFVATRFGSGAAWPMRLAVRLLMPLAARSPEQGARTLLALASGTLGAGAGAASGGGGYFADGQPGRLSAQALDGGLAARLWELTAGLTGLDLPRA